MRLNWPGVPAISFLRARVALESPTFAQKTLFPTMRILTHVEPEKRKLIPEF